MKQPFGTRSKQFTGDLAFGQVVTVKVRDIDRYKRTVAEIILPDGRNLNQEIVRAGLAWWYERYACREVVLQDLEREARDARDAKGLCINKRFTMARHRGMVELWVAHFVEHRVFSSVTRDYLLF